MGVIPGITSEETSRIERLFPGVEARHVIGQFFVIALTLKDRPGISLQEVRRLSDDDLKRSIAKLLVAAGLFPVQSKAVEQE